jgi:hypothetical protein
MTIELKTQSRTLSLTPNSQSLPLFAVESTIYLNGGGERDRTDDLLRARQALSQLSYTPIFIG